MPRGRAQSSSSSGSGAGSGSGSEPGSESGFDEQIEEILKTAPPEGRIGEMLQQFAGLLSSQVETFLVSRGARVSKIKLLKVSFHATFLVELHPPLSHEGSYYSKVIVQVVGSELGDKALYGPISAQNLVRAAVVAERAGVRVAKILAVGEIDASSHGARPLSFVVQEFIETQTVEDGLNAPGPQWHRIATEAREKLRGHSLEGVDTEPLPRFQSLDMWLQWLAAQVPAWDAPLLEALIVFIEGVMASPPPPAAPVLIHSDINSGNLLCSETGTNGQWSLDAVIDWESAAVADPRTLNQEEPWSTACAFAHVVKGSQLAQHLAAGTLPRCELAELVERSERSSQALDKGTWLTYESWAGRVERARAARGT